MIVHNRLFNLLEYMIKRSGLLAFRVESWKVIQRKDQVDQSISVIFRFRIKLRSGSWQR
jgi:hypothetical protein